MGRTYIIEGTSPSTGVKSTALIGAAGVAGDASEESRTSPDILVVDATVFTVTLQGVRDAYTRLSIYPYRSNDNGDTFSEWHVGNLTATGLETLMPYEIRKNTTSDDIIEAALDVRAFTHVRFIFEANNGGADDRLYAWGARKLE